MSQDWNIKDSGKREEFESGMQRDTEEGKTRYDLAYDGPMLKRWAQHLTNGLKKYGARNWMKATGQKELDRFVSSAARHFAQWMKGDRDEDHAAAVMFNINGAEYVRDQQTRINDNRLFTDLARMMIEDATVEKAMVEKKELDKAFGMGIPSEDQKKLDKKVLRPLVYLAGPIRDKRGIYYQQQNIERARDIAVKLWQAGFSVICPHTNTWNMDGGLSADDFIEGDLSQVAVVDALILLPGWENSEGALRERDFALRQTSVAVYTWLSAGNEPSTDAFAHWKEYLTTKKRVSKV